MTAERSEILPGTPDLIVLKTPDARGSLHGYGVARRIEQISEEALRINQGTIHASHVRVLQNGWITAVWRPSENNRQAKFYSITKSGKKQLNAETENRERAASVIGRALRVERG